MPTSGHYIKSALLTLFIGIWGITPTFANYYNIEFLVFTQSNTSDKSGEWDFTSPLIQEKHNKIRSIINRPHSGKAQLLQLAAAERGLKRSGYKVLYTQQWQINQDDARTPIQLTVNSADGKLDGLLTISYNQFLQNDLFLRYRPAGDIANDTDPAYFIEKRQALQPNIYYIDHSKFGVLLGVWEDQL